MQRRTKNFASVAVMGSVLSAVGCGGGTSASSKDDTSSAGQAGGSVGTPSAGGSSEVTGNDVSSTSTSGGAGGTVGDVGTGTASATGGGGGAGALGGDSSTASVTSTSGGESTAGVGVLGDPCDSPGQLACAGRHQKLTLVCGGNGEWEVNQTCSETEFCDSSESETTGLCLEPVGECVDREPGDLFCASTSVVTCGVDGIRTTVVEECTSTCSDGVCDASGVPCPTGAFVDCSSQCEEFRCDVSEDCVLGAHLTEYLEDFGDSVVVRTASFSESCGRNAEACGDEVRTMSVYAFYVRLKYSVEAPWGIVSEARLLEDACAEPRPCEVVDMDENTYRTLAWVQTSDPNAGPANVQVEVAGEETRCP